MSLALGLVCSCVGFCLHLTTRISKCFLSFCKKLTQTLPPSKKRSSPEFPEVACGNHFGGFHQIWPSIGSWEMKHIFLCHFAFSFTKKQAVISFGTDQCFWQVHLVSFPCSCRTCCCWVRPSQSLVRPLSHTFHCTLLLVLVVHYL